VVNNAIVLLEVIETKRREGLAVIDAVEEAIHMRTRPIILTTVTTVAGLLPLALSDTSLWPPLAWAIISGLLASTAFTLLVVPTVYRLVIRDPKPRPEPDGAPDPRPERRLADATAPEPTA